MQIFRKKKIHIKITNPETTHQFVFLNAVCIRAHARRAYAHFTAFYIQRTPRAQACTPHTETWVSSFKGAAKLQVLCEICKYTRRKAASLFSSRTRQICIIRKFLVIIAKPLNYNIMTQQEKFVKLDKIIQQLDKIYDRMEKIKFACLRENPDGIDTDKLYQAEYDMINAMQELRCARQVNEPF